VKVSVQHEILGAQLRACPRYALVSSTKPEMLMAVTVTVRPPSQATSQSLSAEVALSLCGKVEADSSAATAGVTFGDHVDFRGCVSRICLERTWTGLSPFSPILSSYDLAQNGDSFTGHAEFSVSFGEAKRSAEVTLEVPVPVVHQFLSALGSAPLSPAPYEPKRTHSDDYPSISLKMTVGRQIVRVFSESQGPHHVPWGAEIAGVQYLVDSEIPSLALLALLVHLRQDVADSLFV
jgi:hypothetical protein